MPLSFADGAKLQRRNDFLEKPLQMLHVTKHCGRASPCVDNPFDPIHVFAQATVGHFRIPDRIYSLSESAYRNSDRIWSQWKLPRWLLRQSLVLLRIQPPQAPPSSAHPSSLVPWRRPRPIRRPLPLRRRLRFLPQSESIAPPDTACSAPCRRPYSCQCVDRVSVVAHRAVTGFRR